MVRTRGPVLSLAGSGTTAYEAAQLSLIKDWGTLDFFVMPYFRERTFPGEDGRLRAGVVVDTNNPVYESSAERQHLDAAVRWSHYVGDWDFGLAHFSGTGRGPVLVPGLNDAGQLVLIPNYVQIDQTSLDLQATLGGWLWKLELISREELDSRFTAFVGGFEYTVVGAFETAADIGLIMEYQFDDRGEDSPSPAQNDLAVGARFAFNDVQTSPRYPARLALRFARVKGYRPDKRPQDADTVDTVRAIHDGQARRGLDGRPRVGAG